MDRENLLYFLYNLTPEVFILVLRSEFLSVFSPVWSMSFSISCCAGQLHSQFWLSSNVLCHLVLKDILLGTGFHVDNIFFFSTIIPLFSVCFVTSRKSEILISVRDSSVSLGWSQNLIFINIF